MNVHSLPERPHLPPSDVELESRQWLPAAAARIPAAWTVRATLIHARQDCRFGSLAPTARTHPRRRTGPRWILRGADALMLALKPTESLDSRGAFLHWCDPAARRLRLIAASASAAQSAETW